MNETAICPACANEMCEDCIGPGCSCDHDLREDCGHDWDMSCPPCRVCGGCPECGDCDCGIDDSDDSDLYDDDVPQPVKEGR